MTCKVSGFRRLGDSGGRGHWRANEEQSGWGGGEGEDERTQREARRERLEAVDGRVLQHRICLSRFERRAIPERERADKRRQETGRHGGRDNKHRHAQSELPPRAGRQPGWARLGQASPPVSPAAVARALWPLLSGLPGLPSCQSADHPPNPQGPPHAPYSRQRHRPLATRPRLGRSRPSPAVPSHPQWP